MMGTSGNATLDRLIAGHEFAFLLCEAAGVKAPYVSLARVGDDQTSFHSTGNWVGPIPRDATIEPYAANAKVAELLYAGNPDGFSATPVEGFEKGLGWMGAVRDRFHIVGVSGWAEEHDRLLALVVLYRLLNPRTRLHHVGVWYTSNKEYLTAIDQASQEGDPIPVGGTSVYYRTGDYYREFFYLERSQDTSMVHFDLVTPDPSGLLSFLEKAYVNAQTHTWPPQPKSSSVGMLWVADKNGNSMGVYARSEFDPIEDWNRSE